MRIVQVGMSVRLHCEDCTGWYESKASLGRTVQVGMSVRLHCEDCTG